jgi:hypothetical protein
MLAVDLSRWQSFGRLGVGVGGSAGLNAHRDLPEARDIDVARSDIR